MQQLQAPGEMMFLATSIFRTWMLRNRVPLKRHVGQRINKRSLIKDGSKETLG